MAKIDDMGLFIQVVKSGGLAAAGRQLGLSPASMTARIKALEARYDTRLLNRSTRSISLTDAGHRFYEACLRVMAEVAEAEAIFQADQQALSGLLRVTATVDFGRQFVAPALVDFVTEHPNITPYLLLSDSLINLIEEGIDLGIRLGNLPDSNLMMRSITRNNRRILCASPQYLDTYGIPMHPHDLKQHRCLIMEHLGHQLNQWSFKPLTDTATVPVTVKVPAAMIGSDGDLIRQWALAGADIALKSFWDVKQDIEAGRLVTVLNHYVAGAYSGDDQNVGIQIVYPSRQYLPCQVEGFIDYFITYMGIFEQPFKKI